MRPSVRAILVSSCVLTAAVALSAQGGGQQGPQNLKVLPDTWSRQQVGALMSTFNESLGVRCDHCHAEDPNAPPPNPGQNPRLAYELDEKPEKDVARKMIQMVMDMNSVAMQGIGDEAVTEKVTCFTCHHGEAKPARTPEGGWGRGDFTLSEAGPVVPQRGRGAGRGAGRGGGN